MQCEMGDAIWWCFIPEYAHSHCYVLLSMCVCGYMHQQVFQFTLRFLGWGLQSAYFCMFFDSVI